MVLPPLLQEGPADAAARVVLAHGAGAPMDSGFMNDISAGLASQGIAVVRFEFPYMQALRTRGRRGPPDATSVLLECFREVIAHCGGGAQLVIGGKSMGGRMASMLADAERVRGLVCLGYPFHPAGKPERTRVAQLAELQTPALFVQGTRDALGNREEVSGYALSPAVTLRWLEDGDHSFLPRKRSGRTEAQNMDEAIAAIAAFVRDL